MTFTLTAMVVSVVLIQTLAYISKCRGKQLWKLQSLMLKLILLILLYYLYKQNNKNYIMTLIKELQINIAMSNYNQRSGSYSANYDYIFLDNLLDSSYAGSFRSD